MEQQILAKNETIRKMKNGSLIISAVCLVSVLFYIAATISLYTAMNSGYSTRETKQALIRTMLSYGVESCIMIMASAVFYRISRNGCPFISSNILMVRVIGVLFILNGMLNAVFTSVMTGSPAGLLTMVNPSGVAAGMLVIFISYIMHYAALLQTESDETL